MGSSSADQLDSDEIAKDGVLNADTGVEEIPRKPTTGNRRRSVQFATEPPQIIPRRKSVFSTNTEDDFTMHNFSATSKSNQRSRLVKLLVILALPTVVVFAQCGLMISRAIQRKSLQEEAIQSMLYIQRTNALVSCLQWERRAAVLYLTKTSLKNLTLLEEATTAALLDFESWLAEESDGNSYDLKRAADMRNELTRHRLAVQNLNVTRSDEVLWYTSQITDLISQTPKHVWLTSDDDGLIWKDLVALELLFRIVDNLKLEQDLTLSLFAMSSLAPEEIRWISENRSDIQILFKLSLKFLDLSGASDEAQNLVKELLMKQADYLDTVQGNTSSALSNHTFVFGNASLDDLAERTNAMVELASNLTASCFSRIEHKMQEEKDIINQEAMLAYGLLAAVTVVFPLLGVFYVRSVNTMAEVIAAYSGDMLVKSAELSFEKKRTDHLLFQMLPKSVANSLTNNQPVNAESYDCVSIYFSDIVDFEQLTTSYEPLEVIDLLNNLYTMFDMEIENFDAYKVETIGDAYMVASGLPTRNDNRHAAELANLGLSLMSLAFEFVLPRMSGRRLLLRIGIHSGPCVTCVIGLKMPRYCLFGDTVNTASRMESHGSALRIHMSASTKVILEGFGGYEYVSRGAIDVKGKGTMHTWWLTGRQGLDFHIDLTDTEKYMKK